MTPTATLSRQSRLSVLIALLGAPLLLASHSAALGQSTKPVTISSEVACPTCSIALDSIVTMIEDSVLGGVYWGMRLEPGARGTWYSRTDHPFRFVVFDSTGRPIRTFGRKGAGPGEYQSPQAPKALGDSIYVYDAGNGRLTWLTLAGRVRREMSVAPPNGGIEILADGTMLSLQDLAIGGGGVGPITRLSRAGKIIRTFAHDSVPPSDFGSRVASHHRGRIWLSPVTRYRPELWDTAGRRLAAIVRRAEWFADYDFGRDVRPALEAAPRPFIQAAWEDERGLLWTSIRVADRNWEANAKKIAADIPKYSFTVRGAEGSSERLSAEANEMLYDTIVEVIDVKKGRLILSRRYPQDFRWGAARGYLNRYFEDDEGLPRLTIFRPRLVGY